MDIDGTVVERKKGVSKRTAMLVDKEEKVKTKDSGAGWSLGPVADPNAESAPSDKAHALQLKNLVGAGIVKPAKKRQLTRKQKRRKEHKILKGITFAAHLEKKQDIYRLKDEIKKHRRQ